MCEHSWSKVTIFYLIGVVISDSFVGLNLKPKSWTGIISVISAARTCEYPGRVRCRRDIRYSVGIFDFPAALADQPPDIRFQDRPVQFAGRGGSKTPDGIYYYPLCSRRKRRVRRKNPLKFGFPAGSWWWFWENLASEKSAYIRVFLVVLPSAVANYFDNNRVFSWYHENSVNVKIRSIFGIFMVAEEFSAYQKLTYFRIFVFQAQRKDGFPVGQSGQR